jgi:glycosyltransferase involved in cell wall biosynthesis
MKPDDLMCAEQKPKRKIRVLQLGKFYSPLRGGIESHVKTLCECLHAEVSVEVVVSNKTGRTVRETCDGVAVTRVARLFHFNSTSINPAMTAEIRSREADIIHLHWPNPMAAIAYLASGHQGKLIVTYHCDVVKQRLSRRLFSPVLRVVLRRAQAIIVSSQEYLDSSPVLSPYRERCRVIPFGVGEHFFVEPDPIAVKNAQLRFGSALILSVGRMVDYKGFEYLIRAVKNTPGRLLLVGKGPRKRKLMALARSLHLEDRVIFLGELPDAELRDLYHAADLLVLASVDRSEAFGLVQAEAMAAATPVINTALNSGTAFVSPDGVTGLMVPHSDVSALTQAINCLLNDAPFRRDLGMAARARAEQLFRAANMCTSMVALYRDILSVK